jgi:aminocarboxymuconate-semialdehyde decarboxylase
MSLTSRTQAARLGFTGCAMMAPAADGGAAPGATPRPSPPERPHGHAQRRAVTVNGRRVKTIDVHAHCCVPAAMALIDHPLDAPGLLMDDTAARIAAMDAQGIDVEALSINPYWYRAERDAAAELIRIQNETLVEFCAANPERFVGFATAALQHPELAAEQVEHAVKKLGFRGVGVGGSVAGEELANPRFHPFWAKCEELGVLVFLHPQGTRELEASGRLGGSGLLGNTIGNPLETTIALSHLIFEGTLDRFPGLRICAAHGGGYLPSYANRSDAVIRTFPKRVGPLPKKSPTAYLRDGQLFFDTIVFTPEALRHLIAETGADRIMMGTDYPFPWTSTEVDLVLSTPGLSDEQRIAILGGTAARLLGIAP